MAQVVLFDVLGTLVRDPFHDVMPAFFGLSFRDMLAAKHPTRWLDFEHGLIDERTFLAGFFADGRDYDHQGFVQAIQDAYAWLPGMEALLVELVQAGVPLHALSNYPVWYRLIEDRLGLSRYLSWSFVSCETGVRKPVERAFTGPLQTLGVSPGDAVFVDDQPVNVDAATALGLDAIRFEGAVTLRAALVQRGLVPACSASGWRSPRAAARPSPRRTGTAASDSRSVLSSSRGARPKTC